jgi:hypothetical protein
MLTGGGGTYISMPLYITSEFPPDRRQLENMLRDFLPEMRRLLSSGMA